MHWSICTYFIASPAEDFARCCWEENTLRRLREGDASEGCARFRHVFLVCCVNAVGAVEVSISEYEDRISTRYMDGVGWMDGWMDG